MGDAMQNLHDVANEYYYQIGSLNRKSTHLVFTAERNIWLCFNVKVNSFEEITTLNHLHKENKLSDEGWSYFMVTKQELVKWGKDTWKFSFIVIIFNLDLAVKFY